MNFKRYHVSKNLANLYGVNKTALNLTFATTDNMKIVINGTKASGANVINIAYPNIVLPAGTYTVYIKMVGGTITNIESGALFGINGNTYEQRTTPAVNKIGDVGRRTFTLLENTLLSTLDIAPSYSDVGSVWNNAEFECMLYSGSDDIPYEPYSSEVWTNIPHYIHNTSTDTLTTLPAVLYPNAVTATVGLKGDMSQTGTPTPQNPIQPSECGERTGNLLFSSQNQTIGSTLHITQTIGNSNFILNKDVSQSDASANIDIDVTLPAGTYTVSVIGLNLYNNDYDRLFIRDDNSTIVVQNVQVNRPQSFTLTETTHIYRLTVVAASQSTYNNTNIQIMLNSGGTALPYQPYGYKIPILNNSQTTNVYLGEVESTRQIKKYEFTGLETFYNKSSTYQGSFYVSWVSLGGKRNQMFLCDRAKNVSSISNYAYGKCYSDSSMNLWIGEASWSTQDFKDYLATQYTAGTPVTVWYVLAESTTGIVNEPIRKIGDYADEVSGISIPTIAGANTLSIGTTLQPSEVTATYKGWHPVADVHERDSNYTIATMQALTIAQLQTHTISELQGGEWS